MLLSHRDISPKDIMIKDGIIKILDFGISFQQTTRSQLANDIVGRYYLMPPEIDNEEGYDP